MIIKKMAQSSPKNTLDISWFYAYKDIDISMFYYFSKENKFRGNLSVISRHSPSHRAEKATSKLIPGLQDLSFKWKHILLETNSYIVTPLKTNMTSWKIPHYFNRKYIRIHGGCAIVNVRFRGGNISHLWKRKSIDSKVLGRGYLSSQEINHLTSDVQCLA